MVHLLTFSRHCPFTLAAITHLWSACQSWVWRGETEIQLGWSLQRQSRGISAWLPPNTPFSSHRQMRIIVNAKTPSKWTLTKWRKGPFNGATLLEILTIAAAVDKYYFLLQPQKWETGTRKWTARVYLWLIRENCLNLPGVLLHLMLATSELHHNGGLFPWTCTLNI